MPTRLTLVTLALCVATIGATPAPPARPPDGTYAYTLSGAPGLTQTTIVIRSSASGFSVIENVVLPSGAAVSTQTDYDAQTLLPTHYRVSQNGKTTDLVFANGTATLVEPLTARSKPAGTKGLTISEGLFALPMMLPAIVASAGGQPIADLAINGGLTVVTLTPTSAADARPAGVPQNDVESAIGYPNGLRETFWSNPTTYAVDRIGLGTAAALTLNNYSTATTAVTPAPAAVLPTPYPTAQPHFSSRGVSFASSGGATIAGTLTVPNDPKGRRMPAFIFIHGSGAGTRDAAVPANPTFLDLSNGLSNNGVIVLRYDKRAIGKSTGEGTEDWHPLGDDARAAVAFLKHQPSVDPHRIFILGHSEGGEIAPLIAPSIPNLAGIVLMAGPAIALDQIIGKQLPGDKNAAYRTVLLKAFSSYAGLDPAVYITKVNVPILVLQGGRDVQVLASDLPHLVNAARAAHRKITVKVLPEDDHLFLRLPASAVSNGSEYFVPAPLDPRVPQTILQWLRSLPTSAR
jgi:dienelactone hydrolase